MLITVAVFVVLLVIACVTDLADDRRLGRRTHRRPQPRPRSRRTGLPEQPPRRRTAGAADPRARFARADIDLVNPHLFAVIDGRITGQVPLTEGELARRLLAHQLPARDYRLAMERLAAASSVRYPLAPPA